MNLKRFIPIYSLIFVNVIGFSILIPVLPYITDNFNQPPFIYGLLLATYPAFQFFGAPILGSMSDKYGRRPLLLASQTGTLLSWVVFGASYFVPDLRIISIPLPIIVIMLGRIVDGITGGNMSVANAYIIDITDTKERTKVFGLMGAIIGIGLLVGPGIGGYTSSFSIGYLGTAIAAFLISLVTLALMYLYLPESLPEEEHDKELDIHLKEEINVIKKIRKLDNPKLNSLFSLRIFFTFGFSLYTGILTFYAKDKFNLAPRELGLLFLFIGLFLILNQGFLVQKVSHKIGNLKAYLSGQVLMTISMLILPFAGNVTMFLVISYFNNLGVSLSIPTFKSIISHQVEKKRQGTVTGIDESFFAISSSLGPVISSLLYTIMGSYIFFIMAGVIAMPIIYLSLTGWKLTKEIESVHT